MAKRTTKKEKILVKPSELPKDDRVNLRINSLIKKKLKDDGHSLQKILDSAIDKKLSKIEVTLEKKLTIEPKK